MINLMLTIIVLILSYVLGKLFGDASVFFVFCMTILCFMNIIKMKLPKSIKAIIIIAVVARIVLVFVDMYVTRLPDAGSDDDGFYRVAMQMRDGLLPMSTSIHGGLYSIIICLMSYIIGINRLGLQFTNVVLFCISVIYLNKCLDLIGTSKKNKIIIMLIMSFAPYIMFSNSILRRDTLISSLLIVSLYHFIKWYKNNNMFSVFVSLACILIGALLHTAVIFILPFYLIFYLFYNRKKDRCLFFGINTVKQFFLIGIIILFGSYFFANFSTKISQFDSMDYLYNSISSVNSMAGSAYLSNVKVDSIQKLVIYTPIKTIYFLYSPMPWDWRGIMDFLAFALDSLIYIYLIIKIIKSKNYSSAKKTLLIAFATFTIVFSLGTFASGTAIRHRYNVLPFLLVIFALGEKKLIIEE